MRIGFFTPAFHTFCAMENPDFTTYIFRCTGWDVQLIVVKGLSRLPYGELYQGRFEPVKFPASECSGHIV